MTLPTTGPISMGDMNVELGNTRTRSITMTSVRTLAGVPSGPISFSNLRGKTHNAPPPVPSNSTSPSLSVAQYASGEVLTCNRGTWSDATSYTYTFYAGSDIVRSESSVSTFTISEYCIGKTVRCVVKASNSSGSSTASTPNGGPVADLRPTLSSPAVAGSVFKVGTAYNYTPATFSGATSVSSTITDGDDSMHYNNGVVVPSSMRNFYWYIVTTATNKHGSRRHSLSIGRPDA